MKKTRKWFLMAMCVIFTLILPVQIYAETGEGNGVDLSDSGFTEADDLRFVACYIYAEDNEDNPFNNPNRDVRLIFDGNTMTGYLDVHNYNFQDDEFYTRYHVIRQTTYLPYDADGYFVSPSLSDANSMTSSYQVRVNDKDGLTEPLLLADYNEVYLVTGSAQWLKESGKQKLDEMYMLFHSESGSIGDNPATEQVVADETFRYWQQKMISDPSISAWQDEDGNIYTREQMCALGYEVPIASDTSGHGTQGTENSEESDVQEENPFEEEEVVPGGGNDDTDIPIEEEPARNRIPPLFILIVVFILAAAAVAVAFIRKEKNESDLYVD